MKITAIQFDEFWSNEGQNLGLRNTERFRNNLREKIAEFGSTEELDEYVLTSKSGKETVRKLVVRFYEFIGHPDSVLYNKRFFDYPFERQLEIAKFLHEPKTPAEIKERFDIDDRTVRQDLQALENGINVLGTVIQVKREKIGRKYHYKSTLHPIFLPMNLTEIYALTKYLDTIVKPNDVNAEIFRNLTGRIKAQLSPYAFNKLYPEENQARYTNHYIEDENLARQREGILMYLMKSCQTCRFFWKEHEYEGRICLDTNSSEGWRYYAQLTDGTILDADLNELEFIIESLEYK